MSNNSEEAKLSGETKVGEVEVKRIGRGKYLHSIVPILDSSGRVIHSIVKPLMVELRLRDLVQIMVGATILAIPLAFTEETWDLGERLPVANVAGLALISIVAIAAFVYINFYHNYLKGFVFEFVKRVFAIYFISILVVAVLMTLIQQCPWGIDNTLAIKRIIIVGFPACMSAVATDALK